MKIMLGAFSLARSKSSRTSLAPSPMYFWTSSEPTNLMNVACVALATAFAKSVFPVPGGPTSSTPFGGSMPILAYNSGLSSGSSTASRSSTICLLRPPRSSYDTSGLSIISAPVTIGSRGRGRTFMTESVCLLRVTLAPGTRSSTGMYSETETTKSGPVELLTTTRLSGRTSRRDPTIKGGLLSRSSSARIPLWSFCSLNSSPSE